jgi:TolB-like protein
MPIWSAEIKELDTLFTSIKGRFPELEKELEQLIKTEDPNVVMLYSRRCLEVIITDLCESELKRARKTEPLKGIIDKLNREEKVPSHIITSMHSLNSLSTYGAHPKEFDPEQVKPVLSNLTIIIKWYLKYKDTQAISKQETEEVKTGSISPEDTIEHIKKPKKRLIYLLSGLALIAAIIIVALFLFNIISGEKPTKELEKSIIVLPFENISPDPDQEYFCDGMTEEVITDLSKIHDICVISRNTAMTFKGTKKRTHEIAKEVNVKYVLEGSVRKSGSYLRITAQLIDAETDAHLWAEKYSGTLDDVFDIQEEVSGAIADALKVKLNPEERKNITQRPIDNVQAYEYYLKARQEIYRFSEEGLERALQYLEKGLEITGENALLYSCMGNAYFQYWNLGIRLDESYLAKAGDCAERIFQIESNSHYGHLILGLIQTYNDPKDAIREFKIVLKDDPYNDDALLWLCICLVHLGKGEDIDSLFEQLLRTDPLNSIVKVIPGLRLYYRGQFKHALDSMEKAYQPDKEDLIVIWQYGRVLASCGLIEEAIRAFDTVAEKSTTGLASLSCLYSFALRDKKQDVLQSINPDIEQWAHKDFAASLWLAECLAITGECDKAIEWLEQAVNLGFVNYPYLNEYDVFLNNLRGEKKFILLMERVKRKWENFKV